MGGHALMNIFKSFTHGLVSAALIAAGHALGSATLGATTAMAFYAGREVAQHEARNIGQTAFRGFKVWNWSAQTWADLAFPVLAIALWSLLP